MKKILICLFFSVVLFSCAKQQDNYAIAVEMLRSGQYDNAIEMFNTVVNTEQNKEIKADALYNIGLCYGIKKDYDTEIEYYKKAIEVADTCQRALYDLGRYYYDNKDFENSLKMYSHLVEVGPKNGDGYYMLALVQIELGNKEEAMVTMNKALELNSPEARKFLAEQQENNK